MHERGSLPRGGLWPWIFAAVGIVIAVLFTHRLGMRELSSHGSLRVGMQESPPWYFISPDNVIEGPVYDIVQEAARRHNLDIVWVSDPLGPDHALSHGLADLWPLMGRLEPRLEKYDITSSWLDISYVLCSRVVCRAEYSQEWEPRTIVHRGTEVTRSVLAGRFPGASEVSVAVPRRRAGSSVLGQSRCGSHL